MSDWFEKSEKILNLTVGLMSLAETVFNNIPKSGQQKKLFVKSGTRVIVGGMAAASTGGQKETWENINILTETFLDPFIDLAAGFLFPHD